MARQSKLILVIDTSPALKESLDRLKTTIKQAEQNLSNHFMQLYSVYTTSPPPPKTWESEEPSILNNFHEWWQWAKAKHSDIPLQNYIFMRGIRQSLRVYQQSPYSLPFISDRHALLSNAGT